MTSAATFLPAKLTWPASGDFQTEVNFGAAERIADTGATRCRAKRGGEHGVSCAYSISALIDPACRRGRRSKLRSRRCR